MSVIHQFSVEGIDGEIINFADYKGKKIIVVNVASECGYTPQYQQLQELYETFGDRLVILNSCWMKMDIWSTAWLQRSVLWMNP